MNPCCLSAPLQRYIGYRTGDTGNLTRKEVSCHLLYWYASDVHVRVCFCVVSVRRLCALSVCVPIYCFILSAPCVCVPVCVRVCPGPALLQKKEMGDEVEFALKARVRMLELPRFA